MLIITNPLICQLCERDVPNITQHHLIPKQKNTDGRTIDVCVPCSKQIHALFTNKELKKSYDTLEKLKESDKIIKWTEWVRKKNPIDINYHGKGGFHK